MPLSQWVVRGFGVLEHLPPGAQASPTSPHPQPCPSWGPAQAQLPGAAAPATEEPFSGDLKLGTQQPDSRPTETVTPRALAAGTWPAGIQVRAPRESHTAGGDLLATERRDRTARVGGGGGGVLFRALLAHPSSMACWCGPRGDL